MMQFKLGQLLMTQSSSDFVNLTLLESNDSCLGFVASCFSTVTETTDLQSLFLPCFFTGKGLEPFIQNKCFLAWCKNRSLKTVTINLLLPVVGSGSNQALLAALTAAPYSLSSDFSSDFLLVVNEQNLKIQKPKLLSCSDLVPHTFFLLILHYIYQLYFLWFGLHTCSHGIKI